MKCVIMLLFFTPVAYGIDEDRLWRAICKIESGGKEDAIGDGGKAVGVAQIHKKVIDDLNAWEQEKGEAERKVWKYSDRRDRDKSRVIFFTYTRGWCQRNKIPETQENLARIWNGGPNGWKKKSTKKYWEKVDWEMYGKRERIKKMLERKMSSKVDNDNYGDYDARINDLEDR